MMNEDGENENYENYHPHHDSSKTGADFPTQIHARPKYYHAQIDL